MKKFHKNLDFMSLFTAVIFIVTLLFWRTFLNIATTNILLNGIIIGTTLFGIIICFANMFKLLPEYKWLHAYFDGRADYGYSPALLKPIAFALQNRHYKITTSNLTELLDLVAIRMDDKRENIRYITNTLIFLGLLGTFWGLILTVSGFAEILFNLNFDDPNVLQTMQYGIATPLSGMATAFTSSLLGLAGSLTVGFLGMQLQLAQNTIFQDLTDFMSKYIVSAPDEHSAVIKLSENAPVSEDIYTKISAVYESLSDAGYEIKDLIRINGKTPAVVALGNHEQLFIGTVNLDDDVLENIYKRLELCFADTLEGIKIKTKILCVSGKNSELSGNIIHFANVDQFKKYISQHKNKVPKTKSEKEDFNAYAEYVGMAIEYLFKPQVD